MPVFSSLPHRNSLKVWDRDLIKHVGICIPQIYIKGNWRQSLAHSKSWLECDTVDLCSKIRFLRTWIVHTARLLKGTWMPLINQLHDSRISFTLSPPASLSSFPILPFLLSSLIWWIILCLPLLSPHWTLLSSLSLTPGNRISLSFLSSSPLSLTFLSLFLLLPLRLC